jgi:cyclopropane-fatty-acyl-phospholipid synthase
MGLDTVIYDLFGSDIPVRFRAYDGTDIGPRDAAATVTIHSPDALTRMVFAPGELGMARAYVSGDITFDGDLYAVLDLRHRLDDLNVTPRLAARMARMIGVSHLRPLPAPPEEHRARGRSHTRQSDASAISHHYDVSNEFYELVLGPSLTYSCAVFYGADDTLEAAQEQKDDLICQKLGLTPGMRLLDIGCGWGSMAMHAAEHYGVDVVGITLSRRQADLAEERLGNRFLEGRVDIRVQDYRDVADPPFDAISSIGMFEHVGLERLGTYFAKAQSLLLPGGRMLNHAISRTTSTQRARAHPRGFINRYVFPDGALHEVGSVISIMQDTGFEARHMENLREHYALTLRHWVRNLEENWDDAVTQVGVRRARIWRLYMAGSAVSFDDHEINIDQVLAVNTPSGGASGFPLRPEWSSMRDRTSGRD